MFVFQKTLSDTVFGYCKLIKVKVERDSVVKVGEAFCRLWNILDFVDLSLES